MVEIKKNTAFFTLFIFVFLCAQIYKIMHMAPPPENIWDNAVLWDWARDVVAGNFSDFINDSHHRLRWGAWGFSAILIALFSDDVYFYYLSTLIPSILASLLFAYYIFRYIGLWQSTVFLLLWYFNAEMFRATFQLLPTGQALLPVSILLLLLTKIAIEKRITDMMAIGITLAIFWIYGVKETYLAFAPAALWLMYRIGSWRPLMIFSIVFVAGYLLETVFFIFVSADFPIFGRVFAIIDGGSHIKLQFENAHYLAQQTQYYDSGITMRWARAGGMSPLIFFPAYLLAVSVLASRKTLQDLEYKPEHIISLLLLSFMFFTTFFVVSINPIRIGQSLDPRYLAVIVPLSYMLILWFFSKLNEKEGIGVKFALLFIIPFYLAPSINRFQKYPDIGIKQIAQSYEQMATELNGFDCVRGLEASVVSNQLDFIPVNVRGKATQALIDNPEFYRTHGRSVMKHKDAAECEKIYTIHRAHTMRP